MPVATAWRTPGSRRVNKRSWSKQRERRARPSARRARQGTADTALLTELIALRMLMSMVLRSVALGEKLTPEAYAQILAEVRRGKHETTRDVLAQYQTKEQ